MKLGRLINSFRNAVRGLRFVFRQEPNFRLQLAIAALVILLSVALQVERSDRVILFLLILAVLSLELVNSAMEWLTDIVKPRLHDQVARIKDMMAAAVLLASLGAAAVGIIIFWPYF